MTELVVTRGIPASGKTTWARAWVAADETNRTRVNRDDLRQTLYGRDAPLPHGLEEALTAAQHAAVRALLVAGRSVVVDDMHLNARYVRPWMQMADDLGARFWVKEIDCGLAQALRWDEERGDAGGRRVGETFIREAYMRLRSSGPLDLTRPGPDPDRYRYWPDLSLPPAWMFDIDGTLAIMDGRGPYEWERVGEDRPNPPVVEALRAHRATGDIIVLMSGRDSVCRPQTLAWLAEHLGSFGPVPIDLVMRPEGDSRKDAVVKVELFREHVAPNYNVRGVYDDRDQVVEAWRSIGLPCFQVAPGAF